MVVKAYLNERKVATVVDTGCSGVIISQGCYERLGLKEDNEIEMMLSSAVNTV